MQFIQEGKNMFSTKKEKPVESKKTKPSIKISRDNVKLEAMKSFKGELTKLTSC